MQTLTAIQNQLIPWVRHNFDRDPGHPGGAGHSLHGVTEEAGELVEFDPEVPGAALLFFVGKLAHAQLKSEQGIRTAEAHDAKGKDAVADLVIYLADYCNERGWDMDSIVWETWQSVRRRDWKANSATGAAVPDAGEE